MPAGSADALLRARALKRRRNRLIEEYLSSHIVRKLQLGGGGIELDGWLNADLEPPYPTVALLDVREPFPLPDESFDYVFSEHMISFLDFSGCVACLRECRRILKPGGWIRLATPSLERLASLYDEPKTPAQRDYIAWHIEHHVRETDDPTLEAFAINTMFYAWGYKFMHDPRTLSLALERADFIDVRECEVGVSGDPNLAGLERHGDVVGVEPVLFETFVLEARRPPSRIDDERS